MIASPLSTPPLPENVFIVQQRPPANESREQREDRLRMEAAAAEVSRQIDESLRSRKLFLDKRKDAVKILLLGQAESGKTSVLKHFQMVFTPNQFNNEREVWKRVIQLNVISHVKIILLALQEDISISRPPSRSRSRSRPSSPLGPSHRRLLTRLFPILQVDENREVNSQSSSPSINGNGQLPQPEELLVRAGSDWKSRIQSSLSNGSLSSADTDTDQHQRRQFNLAALLQGFQEDLLALWGDAAIRQMLRSRHILLENMSGFFLDDIERIATSEYTPTDADVVRARVRTLGVEEHHFVVEESCPIQIPGCKEFFVIDVAGHRGARASWIPYFEDVQAILFLAPLLFNQMLEEDRCVNRVEDSLMSWRVICSNRLLASTRIILFFNKRDVLQRIIKDGARMAKYVPSYGDKPNEIGPIIQYFRSQFLSIHKKCSPKSREFFCYETSAIDTHSMRTILVNVHEGILRHSLGTAYLLL